MKRYDWGRISSFFSGWKDVRGWKFFVGMEVMQNDKIKFKYLMLFVDIFLFPVSWNKNLLLEIFFEHFSPFKILTVIFLKKIFKYFLTVIFQIFFDRFFQIYICRYFSNIFWSLFFKYILKPENYNFYLQLQFDDNFHPIQLLLLIFSCLHYDYIKVLFI